MLDLRDYQEEAKFIPKKEGLCHDATNKTDPGHSKKDRRTD